MILPLFESSIVLPSSDTSFDIQLWQSRLYLHLIPPRQLDHLPPDHVDQHPITLGLT